MLVNDLVEAGFSLGRFIGLRSARGAGLQPGDFIVGIGDDYSESLIDRLGEEYGIMPRLMKTFDQSMVSPIRQPLLGVYSGEGAGVSYTQDLVETLCKMGFRKISLLTGPLTASDLSTLDVLIFGGGDSFRMLSSLSPEEARLIRQFIESGGVYVGICAGAMLPVRPANLLWAAYGGLEAWGELQLVDCEILSDSVSEPSWPVFSGRRLGSVLRMYPVKGPVKSRIVKKGLLTLGYRGEVLMLHTGPLVKAVEPSNVFGRIESPGGSVEYGLPYETVVEAIKGASSIVMVEHGSGRIVLFFSHVESAENPAAHGLLGNALLLKTYGDRRKGASQAEEFNSVKFMEAAESYRTLRLISDSMVKVVEQVDNVLPGLYANQFYEEASRLSTLKQVLERILTRENVVLSSIEEAAKAEKTYHELKKKGLLNTQSRILSSSLVEWGYVVSKARKALPPMLEKIIESQDLMVDLSTTTVSSEKNDVERRFALVWNTLVGGRADPMRGIPASLGVITPLTSILLNFTDSLEKMKFLRRIIAYANPT
jgi:hypothetical protein